MFRDYFFARTPKKLMMSPQLLKTFLLLLQYLLTLAFPDAAGDPASASIPAIAGIPVTAVAGYSSAAAGVPDVVACGTTSTRCPCC